MDPMYRVKFPVPQHKHVLLAKAAGGFLTFWVLWRATHDWHVLFTHFDANEVWKIPDPNTKSGHHSKH